MNAQLKSGDRVEVTRTNKGFFNGRYEAVVISTKGPGRLKVETESGQVKHVLTDSVRKLD